MPMVHKGSSEAAYREGSLAFRDGASLKANPYRVKPCMGGWRHWYTEYGQVGNRRDTCARCHAPKPTAEQRRKQRYWRQGWLDEQDHDVTLSHPERGGSA